MLASTLLNDSNDEHNLAQKTGSAPCILQRVKQDERFTFKRSLTQSAIVHVLVTQNISS